jgi:hypothetical protein
MRRTSLSQTVSHTEDNLGDEEDNLGDEEDNLGDDDDKFIANSIPHSADNPHLLDCLLSVVLFVINFSSSSPRLSSSSLR